MLDNPTHHAAERTAESQTCPRCEYTWDVLGLSEYGAWSPWEITDLICPDCGRNLMEV